MEQKAKIFYHTIFYIHKTLVVNTFLLNLFIIYRLYYVYLQLNIGMM